MRNHLSRKSSRIILEHLETLQGMSKDSWTSPELGALPLGEGGGAKHSPPGGICDIIIKIIKNHDVINHQQSSWSI